jgi:glycosyltransferase involved in cell wall biosynthesis
MHRDNVAECLALYDAMNIHGDAVISNQGAVNFKEIVEHNGNKVTCLSSDKRGVSLNRNTAIAAADGDVFVIADDDLVYRDDYAKMVVSVYDENPDVGVVVFDVPSTNPDRPSPTLDSTRVLSRFEAVKFSGFQITFRAATLPKAVRFNEFFGPGAKYLTGGEDGLFLDDAYRAGLKIMFATVEIATVTHADSTWASVEWREPYFLGKGALFASIHPQKARAYSLYHAFSTFSRYKRNLSFFKALRLMEQGRKQYIADTKH